MDYQAIQEMIREMSQSTLYRLEIQTKDIQIKMQKGPDAPDGRAAELNQVEVKAQPPVQAADRPGDALPALTPALAPEPASASGVEAAPETAKAEAVLSPMVATFYSSSGPEQAPFVQVGDRVKKGQVLCILEAMKLMNEIESEYEGEVVAILVENGAMVEYGQPLFEIRRWA